MVTEQNAAENASKKSQNKNTAESASNENHKTKVLQAMKVTKQINATSNEKSQNYNAESHKVTNLKILLK